MRFTASFPLTLTLIAAPLLVSSCEGLVGGDDDEIWQAPATASDNGLTTINGLSAFNGLTAFNGLSLNGLSAFNGLLGSNEGRATFSYVVRCALPAGRTITKTYNGTTYPFSGALGVAPGWENGVCDTNCQQIVSACVMAHVNTTGRRIPIYLDSPVALGLGRSNAYPMQEGAFFGNIFVSPPQAYYCNGYDWDRGPVAGRIGAGSSGSPYKNPFSGNGLCQSNCSTVGYNAEAFTNCAGFGNNVVTVYRDFDASVPYTICNKLTNMCLDVSGSSPTAGTPIVMWWRTGANNQKFYFERARVASHDGNYRIRSASSGLYVDINGGSTASGATAMQWSNNGGTSQMWNMVQVVQGSYLIENERSRLLLNAGGVAAGASVPQRGSGYYTDAQMWKLTLAQ